VRRTFNDVAALAARVGVGSIFFANGWHKLEAGLVATGQQFGEQGAPAPAVWAAATMLIELIGGALLVAGFAVPVCGILLFAEALAVFAIASGDQGLPLTGGDTKLIVALGAASILLAVVGAGRMSVDHVVVIRRRESEDSAESADEVADREAEAVIASLREPTTDPGGATRSGTAKGGTARAATGRTGSARATMRRTDGPQDGTEQPAGAGTAESPEDPPGKRTRRVSDGGASKDGAKHAGKDTGKDVGDDAAKDAAKEPRATAEGSGRRSRGRRADPGQYTSTESRSEAPAEEAPAEPATVLSSDRLVAGGRKGRADG
jgi:putative oxidoreductase